MKKRAGTIPAIPSKRLYLSIIADYDLNRSICELVDNVLDLWSRRSLKGVKIEIELDDTQQTIRVRDDAGGVAERDLALIVSPGQTDVDLASSTIGIFGVGSKRAVVALAQDVAITTRSTASSKTFRLEFDDDWIKNEEDWNLDYFEVDPVDEGTTQIELSKLRNPLNPQTIEDLRTHLGATYATFLANERIQLFVNHQPIDPTSFEEWAYPPGFEPRDFAFQIETAQKNKVSVRAIAGLTRQSHPSGEYGLYLYCNGRLVAGDIHDSTIGFVTGQIGVPHPDISLVRMVLYLDGPAYEMPWNSSKSAINPAHAVFVTLRDWIAGVIKEWASLSRRWSKEGWKDKVFQYESGAVVAEKIPLFPEPKRTYLPPMPKAKPRYPERVRNANEKIAADRPWTRGLYESVAVADIVYHKEELKEKNRVALIVLDSTLEIAFKEFLVNEAPKYYSDADIRRIFEKRHLVHAEIRPQVKISAVTWKKIKFYYELRCKLTHERATVGITDDQVDDFREVVEKVLKRLFGLNFRV